MYETVNKFANEMVVHNTNLTRVRVGNEGDGGYIILKEACEKVKSACCIGIGDDIGFEVDFVRLFPNIQMKLLDPFINGLPQEHDRFSFDKRHAMYFDVEDDCLLKIDMEWDEWDFLDMLTDHTLRKPVMIIGEFHIVYVEPDVGLTPYFYGFYKRIFKAINSSLFESYCSILTRLNKYFYCFHIHANNSLPIMTMGDYSIPPLLEFGFVRKGVAESVGKSIGPFPVPGLDFPNKKDRADIVNYYPFKK